MRRMTGGAILVLLLGLLFGAPARSAFTAPVLVLNAVQATRTPIGTLLRVEAEFPQPDLIQKGLAIQVFVRERTVGSAFLRYELGAGGFAGVDPALADGLDSDEVFGVVDGSLPDSGIRLLALLPERIELLLPGEFPAGPAEAQLFLLYEGEPVLSNAIEFTIAGPSS